MSILVPVTCAGCGASYLKTRQALYGWSGLCRSCSRLRHPRSMQRVTVTCRRCGASWEMLKNVIPLWHGLCRACVVKAKHPFACPGCGRIRAVTTGTSRNYEARCASCRSKACMADPAFALAHRERARRQVLAQGGIPNRKVFTPERVRGAASKKWKGGITPEHQRIRNSPEHKAWARAVKERDDFTCQMCGNRGGRLHADHLLSFAEHPEARFDVSNGRTLCASCHARHHKPHGPNPRAKYPESLEQS